MRVITLLICLLLPTLAMAVAPGQRVEPRTGTVPATTTALQFVNAGACPSGSATLKSATATVAVYKSTDTTTANGTLLGTLSTNGATVSWTEDSRVWLLFDVTVGGAAGDNVTWFCGDSLFGGGAGQTRSVLTNVINANSAAANIVASDTLWKQMDMDMTTVTANDPNLVLSTDGTMMCNTGPGDLDFPEIHLGGIGEFLDNAREDFLFNAGNCTACSTDSFPQLVDADVLSPFDFSIEWPTGIDHVPVVLLGAPLVLPADGCIGLMMKAANASGDGENVKMHGGTWNIFATR